MNAAMNAAMSSAMNAAPGLLLLAQGLSCERGGREVCRDQHLRVTAGSSVWLRGRNGSGKTSLLRVLAGLGAPTQGELWQAPHVEHIYIGHGNALKSDLSIAENLAFLAALNELDRSPVQMQQALRVWGLWAHRQRPARVLSQGLQRRLGLARLSLAGHKRLWLLDEPFDALDDLGVETLGGQIQAHCARGGACVLSSHVAWPAARLATEHWLHPTGAAS